MQDTTARPITYVIACGGEKLDRPAPARELYTGQMFRHTLDNALRSAELDREGGRDARVLILSAQHGLVKLDEVLEPYDLRMDAPGSVTAERLAEQAAALGIDFGDEVYGLLPRPYLARLDEALRTLDVFVQDVYEACGGIGEQRGTNRRVGQPVPPIAVGDVVTGRCATMGRQVTGLVLEVLYVRLESFPRYLIATDDSPSGSTYVETAERVDPTAPLGGLVPADCSTPEGRRAWLAQQTDDNLHGLQRYMADLIDKGIEVDDDALDDLGVEVRRRRVANPPAAAVRTPEHPNMAKIREKVAGQSTALLLTSHRIAVRQIRGTTGDERQAIALVLTTVEAELQRRDVEPPSRLA